VTTPTVVIVDDHALFRSGVRAELDGLVEVAGDAGSVEEGVRLILEAKPDVVLLDVHMPGGGGVEVIRRVAETAPAVIRQIRTPASAPRQSRLRPARGALSSGPVLGGRGG